MSVRVHWFPLAVTPIMFQRTQTVTLLRPPSQPIVFNTYYSWEMETASFGAYPESIKPAEAAETGTLSQVRRLG